MPRTSKQVFHHSPVNPTPEKDSVRVLVGTPTLGLLRAEWCESFMGIVSPPNFAVVRSMPRNYTVADAQNMLVGTVLREKMRALLLIEDDTVPPPQTYIEMDRWFWKMERRKAPPVVSGVYHIKGSAEVRKGKTGGIELLGPEPLIYRGGGLRAHRDFEYGDVVWCSGVPTGALMIHHSLLEAWANEPDIETYTLPGYPAPLKRIFQNPSHVWVDPETKGVHVSSGTSDLWWSEQTIKRGLLAKAGWGDYYKQKDVRKHTNNGEWPYIVDTSLRFGHICRMTGAIY